MSGLGYRPEVDGLRGIAVLLVLLNHAELPPFRGGFLGVDVFFVLSGYLITAIIVREMSSGDFTYRSFLERRARRILPAMFAMLLPVSIAASIVLGGSDRRDFYRSLVAVASFWSNIRFYLDIGYFDTAAAFKPLLHTWSLGIEEQFYLVYPCLLILLRRVSAARGLALISILSLFGFAGMLVVSPGAAFYLLPFRSWELLFGASIALIERTDLRERYLVGNARRIMSALGPAGLVAILMSAIGVDKYNVWPSAVTLVPVLGAGLVLLVATPGSVVVKLLSSPPLVLVGLCSYSIYLWHLPLFSLGRYQRGGLGVDSRVLLVAISLLVGWCSWRIVETPIRDRSRFSRRGIFAASLAGSILFAATGMSLLARSGDEEIKVSPPLPARNKPILLVGDSHAAHLVPGLVPYIGDSLAVSQSAGCVPLWEVDRFDSRFQPGACAQFATAALQSAIDSPDVKLVVLASMGPVYITGETFRGYDQARVTGDGLVLVSRPEIRDRWQVYELGLRDTLSRLVRAGKEVVVMIDVPELGIPPQNCKASNPDSCENSRSEIDDRSSRYRDLVKYVSSEFPNVSVFDPTQLFCSQSNCFGIKDGQRLYEDVDHLSEFGSKYLGAVLAPFLMSIVQSL